MARRYLDVAEVQAALARGRSVECFLGRCERDGQSGVRWFSLSPSASAVRFAVFESADYGDDGHHDLYEFGPLDPKLELDEPDRVQLFALLSDALAAIEVEFPGAAAKLVNEGLVQAEYADFVARGRHDA